MPSILERFLKAAKRIGTRVPQVGDPIWWAPKMAKCVIVRVHHDGSINFVGGPEVRRPSGRVTPRWAVATAIEELRWNDQIKMWVLGQGRMPKNVRGTVLEPDPIVVTSSIGSQPGTIL